MKTLLFVCALMVFSCSGPQDFPTECELLSAESMICAMADKHQTYMKYFGYDLINTNYDSTYTKSQVYMVILNLRLDMNHISYLEFRELILNINDDFPLMFNINMEYLDEFKSDQNLYQRDDKLLHIWLSDRMSELTAST